MKRIITQIKKREGVYLCIGIGELAGGYQYGEVRQFIRDEAGTLNPTPKGFTFKPSHLPDIIKGLEELHCEFFGK